MIIFAQADGTVQSILPSPVYQGSALSGGLYFVAPLAASNGVDVAFELPSGNVTEHYPLTPVAENLPDVVNKLGSEYAVWEWQYSNAEITAISGVVSAQFRVFYGVDTLATAAVNFTVQEGVEVKPDGEPTDDQWSTLVQLYSKLATVKMTDFTVDENTGIATKVYSNGTTATVQLPTKNNASPQQPKTKGITVLAFTEENSWTEVANSAPKKYYIAYGASSTNQGTGNYIVQLESDGKETYLAGTETVESEHSGNITLPDNVFKGSDGSLYIESATPYTGRVLVFSDVLWNNYSFNAAASIDGNTGTPSVTVFVSDKDTTSPKFNFLFSNLKGNKGDKGDTGASVVGAELIKE